MLNFPSNPTLNQIYNYGAKSWKWNGRAWIILTLADVSVEDVLLAAQASADNAEDAESGAVAAVADALVHAQDAAASALSIVGDAEQASDSAAAALAAQTAINHKYRGALAADPSTRIDGSVNVAGDEYFNSPLSRKKVFSGTGWYLPEDPLVAEAINTLTAFNARGAFAGATAYALKDVYVSAGIAYVAVIAHTSTSVAADLAAGKVAVHQGATKEDLASLGGSLQVGHDDPLTAGFSAPYLKTVSDMLGGLPISSDRFIDKTKISAIKGYTSTYNAQPDLQKGIYACMYEAKSGKLHIQHGLYSLEDVLSVGFGDTFRQLALIGSGSSYRGSSSFGGTVFLPQFSDRPAIAVQGGRRVKLADFSLLGKNHDFLAGNGFGGSSPTSDDTALASWIDSTLHATANSRYAPYAGIAVDPYSGVKPGTAYPAVTYPASLGAVAQYGKNFSDVTLIDNVAVQGFVVALAIQPGDSDSNGDFVSVTDSIFNRCAYGISAGNSQSRQVNVINSTICDVHTAFTNRTHGRQVGKFGGVISGSTIERVIRILDVNRGTCGPMVFDGCYGELVWRLGDLVTPGVAYPIAMNSCDFSLDSGTVAIRGVPANIVSGGEIQFSGGMLRNPSIVSMGPSTQPPTITNTAFTASDMYSSPSAARLLAQHASAGVMPVGVAIIKDVSPAIRHYIGTDTVSFAAGTSKGRATPLTRIAQTVRQSESAAAALPIAAPRNIVSVGKTGGILSLTGLVGTLDFTTSSVNFRYGIRAGDVVQDDQTGTLFLVTGNTALVANVTALNNYSNPDGAGNVIRTAISASVGSWYVLNSRTYGTTYPLFGTITAGSPIITAIGRGDGFANFAATDIAVGDYLWQHDWLIKYFGVGVTVTAADTTAKTITLSGNAAKAGADVPLNFWVRA